MMKQEQVIEWARSVGAMVFQDVHGDWIIQMGGSRAERFAALVAAHEREQCAKVCEQSVRFRGVYFAQAIRARVLNKGE